MLPSAGPLARPIPADRETPGAWSSVAVMILRHASRRLVCALASGYPLATATRRAFHGRRGSPGGRGPPRRGPALACRTVRSVRTPVRPPGTIPGV